MERLTITTSEPTTVGQLKIFLAKFPDDEQVTVSKNFSTIVIGEGQSIETGNKSVIIAPR